VRRGNWESLPVLGGSHLQELANCEAVALSSHGGASPHDSAALRKEVWFIWMLLIG
jgi:hypothetical protein